jgi:DNA-binding NarL/FixJ family response regulator
LCRKITQRTFAKQKLPIMKIALFDDHPIILNGLNQFFSEKEDVEIVGMASTKAEVFALLSSEEVDILVSDVMTDEELGLELFEEIQKAAFQTKVIVYSSLQGDFVHNFLYEYGVVGIINKNRGLDELWQLVEVIYLTEEYKKGDPDLPPPTLTPKERDIVKYMTRGLSAKEISTLTNTSIHTINNQKNHLLAKFGCMNATELTSRLIKMGYIKL